MEAEKVLQEIAGQVAACKSCQLSFSRKKAVPGEGPAKAEIMLIGEGPGFYENEQGRPFVGAAGKFLDELLEKAGVSRKDVFITNVVKCRPPGNRDPLPEELSACGAYLDRQIEAINPLIIVTLGRYSMSKFLPNVRISEVHGQPAWVRGRLIIPMFHPAAALHQPSLKTSVERDFSRLPEWIHQARQNGHGQATRQGAAQPPAGAAAKPPRPDPVPQQASLLAPLEVELEKPEDAAEEKPENDQPTQLTLF
ncbi:MAG: uracil-DNA glycosylase [Chloroflexi bacterium]|nr:MAG: uracil-DNA glycosylase [Chloroflexota bacterium]